MDTHEIAGEQFYNAALELLLQNLAQSRALGHIIAVELSNEDQVKRTALLKAIESETQRQRKKLNESLYENFGYLPPDILGLED